MTFKSEDRKRNKKYLVVDSGINNNSQYDGVSSWQIWKKKRFIISIFGFFGYFSGYALRSNLSIAIVDMTTIKNVTLENGTIVERREFEWDSTAQGYVLSSFFYGYIVTQIAGGYLAAKFGGAKVFGLGIASTAIFTVVTPWVAKTNVYLLIALRVTEGLFEGVTYPAMLALWANWAPPLEKTRLTSISISGTYVGTLVAMPVSSLLATSFGWETIFYVSGGFALIWYFLWVIVVEDSPTDDKRIRPEELRYITHSINAAKTDEPMAVPWFSLLTSKEVWALSLILSCETWGFYTLLTFLPQMMKSALNFDINKSAFLSGLPYLAMTISTQGGGQIADWMIKKKYMTVTVARKSAIFIGFMSQAIFLLAAALWTSPLTTPIFVVLGAVFGGIALSGIMVNPLDIAPKFGSIIYGINNTFGTIPGIVSPILTGYIVTDLTNVDQWKIIFYITSGIYLMGAIMSIISISGEIQPWAQISTNENVDQFGTISDERKYKIEQEDS